jgi:nickel/cobalt transporter (NicO) family protein
MGRLEQAERSRGDLAAWALVAFGAAYALWGARRSVRQARGLRMHNHGSHIHLHDDAHAGHGHAPAGADAGHERGRIGARTSTGFWALFIIFVLGPCEPLIPLFILPASRGRWALAMLTAALYAVLTVGFMAALTYAGMSGLRRLPLGSLEAWADSLAGAAIAGSGLVIISLEL